MTVERSALDASQRLYKEAVNDWIVAIRAEEALATEDHSPGAWDKWEQAGFKAQEAQERAIAAREAYKDELRKLDYQI